MRFRGDYWFLSNFYPAPIRFEGLDYPTSEHAYAAQKARDFADHELIRMCRTPGEAKRFARTVPQRADWDLVKLDMMREILRCKFSQHSILRMKLLATYPDELVEDNTWGDTFWGRCNGVGHNHLGRLLMETRDWLYRSATDV